MTTAVWLCIFYYFSGTCFTFTGERASEVGAVELSVKEVCSLQRVGSLSYSISYGHVRRITESTVEDGHLYPCTWAGVASGCITLFACCRRYILASICSVHGMTSFLPTNQHSFGAPSASSGARH